MTLSPSLAEAGPETLTARSAFGLVLTIVPVTVAVLLAVLGSGLLALTEAVSVKVAPLARLDGAVTTRVKVSELPEAMLAVAVSVTVPPDCDEGEGVGARGLRHRHEGRAGRQGVGQDDALGGVGAVVGDRDGVGGVGPRRDGGRPADRDGHVGGRRAGC